MSKDMLGVAVRKLVTLPGETLGIVCDLLEKLADPEWVEALKRFLRKKEEPWLQVAKETILQLVTTVSLPAIKAFSAKGHFQVGENEGVKIGWIGENFKGAFLSGVGKTEENVPAGTLRVHQLRKSSVDSPIIAELGGEEVAETTLAQMWKLMEAQGHGQKGHILVNGFANIFYIRDAKGVFWAVYCCWRADYAVWYVGSYPVRDPFEWCGGYQIVSR